MHQRQQREHLNLEQSESNQNNRKQRNSTKKR